MKIAFIFFGVARVASLKTSVKIPLKRSSTHGRQLQEVSELTNCKLTLWYGELCLGTPRQCFNFMFDSGSSDMWIGQKGMSDGDGSRLFDRGLSSTFSETEEDFRVGYADGSTAIGVTAIDVLGWEGLQFDEQQFGLVSAIGESKRCGQDGMLGLGFHQIAQHKHMTPFENIMGQLNYPMFSFYLDDTMNSASSFLYLGGVNQKHYDGCLLWHNLGNFANGNEKFEGYWDVKMTGVTIGGEEIMSSVGVAVVDSGSTYERAKRRLEVDSSTNPPRNRQVLGSSP